MIIVLRPIIFMTVVTNALRLYFLVLRYLLISRIVVVGTFRIIFMPIPSSYHLSIIHHIQNISNKQTKEDKEQISLQQKSKVLEQKYGTMNIKNIGILKN